MAAKYGSGVVTPEQRGSFGPQTKDGTALSAWSPPETVENAHDQQAAPDSLYTAPLNRNGTGLPAAPVADR